jgi:signal transduction histidine kinase
MKFSYKLFAAIFFVAIAALMISEVAILRRVSAQTEADYVRQYRNYSQKIGDTLKQIDVVTELLMKNAAYVLREREMHSGLPSTAELKKLRDELHMFNLYITDDQGKFIRSTWASEWPVAKERPLFTYCEDYRGLITGRSEIARTPILRAPDLSWPFKFLMIPNHNRTRILEASVAMDFVGDTLKNAMKPDDNIVSIELFTPNGNVLGYVHSEGRKELMAGGPFDASTVRFDRPESTTSGFTFYSKVATTVEDCCECRTKGLTLPDGKYYYILRTKVSRASLDMKLAGIKRWFFAVGLLALALSCAMAFALSRHLVRRLDWMGERVGEIARSGDWTMRLRLRGRDEIGALARKFDEMLERLNASQAELASAEKEKAKFELASQVAHDIRSPLAALDSVVGNSARLPEEDRALIRSAVSRINDIANGLLARNRKGRPSPGEETRARMLSSLVEALIAEKRMQFQSKAGIAIRCELGAEPGGLFAAVQPTEFKRALSNLINNAVEALGDEGEVRVSLIAERERLRLEIRDTGKGIPPDVLAALGKRGETHGKADGTGLGLHHARAAAAAWGGSLELRSGVGRGTTVTLILPRAQAPSALDAVLIDDDPLTRTVWAIAAKEAKKSFKAYSAAPVFLADLEEGAILVAKGAALYLDSELGDGVKGEDIAAELHRRGFTNIRIATGYDPSQFAASPHIREVVGKGPPWA